MSSTWRNQSGIVCRQVERARSSTCWFIISATTTETGDPMAVPCHAVGSDRNPPMTDDKLYTSLSANTIMAKLTNHFQRTRLITTSTDKHYSLDSEDDFRSGCRNVSHQQQFFSELPSPERSHYRNY